MSPFLIAVEEFKKILSICSSIFSRSAKDVFPFFLKPVELYRQAEEILYTLNSVISSKLKAEFSSSPQFSIILKYMDQLLSFLTDLVNDSDILGLVLQLETIGDVFVKAREILGQSKKSGNTIRNEINTFLTSIRILCSFDKRYATIEKRFKMYDRELYVAYDENLVPRTNNNLELFNNTLKRPIRKNMGQKFSWFYIEHLGENIAYFHNIMEEPFTVGGTPTHRPGTECPLERLGVISSQTVNEIMNLVDYDVLNNCLEKIESRYTIHRWIRKISMNGLEKYLIDVDNAWRGIVNSM